MAPVAAGLLLSGGVAVLRASPGGWTLWLAAFGTTAMLWRWPKLHPIPLLLAGAVLFAAIGQL